jgi:plastocyanin
MKRWVLLVALWVVPASVQATEWRALAGVQSTNKGRQVIAFLPNEVWVHAGDSVTWHFFSDETHTVSFLIPGQIRPTYLAGCPGSGTTPDGSSFTGTACVNSGTLATGQSYTVNFPIVGNFKLVCLVHANMTAAIHVLDWSEVLPHDQAFYDREAQREAKELLLDGSLLESRGVAAATRSSGDEDGDEHHHEHGATTAAVTAGISEVVATGGAGSHSVSVMRFLSDPVVIHVGETVEWTNFGPVVQHTVTFGTEPVDPSLPSAGVTVDPDGARHAFINAPTDNVNSGYLTPDRQERPGLTQTPLAQTRFRATFTQPGVFKYICTLHDNLGMVGRVIVLP